MFSIPSFIILRGIILMKLFLLLGVTSQRPKYKNFGWAIIGEFTKFIKTGTTITFFSVLICINPYS